MSEENTGSLDLAQPLVELLGVGGERAAQLARLKCLTVGHLLKHRPRRYEDRRDIRPIRDLSPEEPRLARGKIMVLGTNRLRGGRRKFEFVIEDDSGSVRCRWWNCNYMERLFHRGDDVLVYGKLTGGKLAGLDHPETEIIKSDDDPAVHVNRIVPVYPLTEGMPQRWLRRVIFGLLEKHIEVFTEPNYTSAGLLSRREAIRQLHFPDDLEQAKAARRRLALDEFVELQSTIRRRRVMMQTKAKALQCAGDGSLVTPFLRQLEFQLTNAQRTVQMEIEGDLNGRHPMRRLLQGDVGSGKTVVAALALLRALESGYNVLIMAPTEILAGQHCRNFAKWLKPLGICVRLHTGARKDTDEPLFEKRTLVIGTHALFQNSFNLERVGLIIIDEQHKFGVTQRDRLMKKGHYPHLLVMTATPIPRTLGLTLYGDLDSSVIDEMPAGRGKVRTHIRTPERWPKILDFLKTELTTGKQAFVIFPRVENEDSAGGIKAVKAEAQKLATDFAPHTVAVLHGGLKPEEKEAVMAGFRKNQTQVLLATTVVEVGVDVPNATLMLIENAEQFGLAQLHQLRGRIGRGVHDSHCILLTRGKSTKANERLTVLAETNDGFKIAEADLQLRGPGELVGQDQSGLPAFKFGDLRRDLDLIELARHIALEIEAGR